MLFLLSVSTSPWADTGVEVDQCLFVSRRCAIRSGDTSYQGNPEQNGEEIQYPCVGNSEFHDDCRYYSGSHSPEIAFAVETPPMPFEYVGCDVSTKECIGESFAKAGQGEFEEVNGSRLSDSRSFRVQFVR